MRVVFTYSLGSRPVHGFYLCYYLLLTMALWSFEFVSYCLRYRVGMRVCLLLCLVHSRWWLFLLNSALFLLTRNILILISKFILLIILFRLGFKLMKRVLTYFLELCSCMYLQRLQALSGKSTSCFGELRGFQPVSPGFDVGSPYLR